MAEQKQTDKDFHVLVVNPERNSGFHSGYDTKEQAEAAAKDCNARAEADGYKARYHVKEKANSPVG